MDQSDITHSDTGQALQFRSFQDADYSALAEFLTRLHPDEPADAAVMRRFDQERVPDEHFARTLAWSGSTLLGLVITERSRNFTQPGWYGLRVRAEGAALRAQLESSGLEALRPLSPRVLHTTVSEAWPECGWLLNSGWHEHERMWLSHLDLNSFEPQRFAERRARAQAAGIEIRTPTELGWNNAAQHGSEEMQRRQYELTVALLADVPSAHPVQPWSFELWQKRVVGNPDFTPDGPLIAVQGDEWVGLSELYLPRREVPGMLHQGLTGVRRQWRGKGIAWALKLAGAERAKAQGWQSVRTANHTVNAEMLGINAEMGFVREPARVVLIREWNRREWNEQTG